MRAIGASRTMRTRCVNQTSYRSLAHSLLLPSIAEENVVHQTIAKGMHRTKLQFSTAVATVVIKPDQLVEVPEIISYKVLSRTVVTDSAEVGANVIGALVPGQFVSALKYQNKPGKPAEAVFFV